MKSSDSLSDEERKLRDFYRAAMDESAIEKLGATPLQGPLKKIDNVSDAKSLIVEVGRLHTIGIGALFSFSVSQDQKQSERYAAHLDQGGLGLPDRDYYVGKSADSKRILAKYREHVAKTFELLGDKPEAAAAGADTVLQIETKLAEESRTPVQLREVRRNTTK